MHKRRNAMDFVVLLIAGIINAIGVNLFLSPLNLYDSGFSGTSMLLTRLTPEDWTLAFFLVILNTPFFVYGFKKQGLAFTMRSLFAVAIYSGASFVITYFLPDATTSYSIFAGNDILLGAIFGGVISGIGSGLTIRFGGAIDGVEVMAVIFARRLGLTVGNFVMIYNVILYMTVGVVMNSFILPLYSVIAYCAAIKAIDFIVEGFDKAKSAMIITTKEDQISEQLSETFGRGITHIAAKGYYHDKEQTIVYFVVNRFQIAKMKAVVSEADPEAFVTISEVSDIMGSTLKEKN